MLTLQSLICRDPQLVAAPVDTGVMMLSVRAGKFFHLGDPGHRIWELLAEPRTVADLVERLLDEYAVDREACERDTLAFLEQLAASALIEIRE